MSVVKGLCISLGGVFLLCCCDFWSLLDCWFCVLGNEIIWVSCLIFWINGFGKLFYEIWGIGGCVLGCLGLFGF